MNPEIRVHEPSGEIDALECEAEIEELAEEVKRRGLSTIVLFLLEAHRPLRGVVCHLTTISMPVFVPFFGAGKAEKLLRIMESDASLEKLIKCIEQKSQ